MSDLATMIIASVKRLCEQHCTTEVIESAERGRFPGELWTPLSEAGILNLLVPEELGGVGATLADAAAALIVLGYFAAPGPIVESMVANGTRTAMGWNPVQDPQSLAVLGVDAAAQARAETPVGPVRWAREVQSILLVAPASLSSRAAIIQSADADWEDLSRLCGEPAYLVTIPGGALSWSTAPEHQTIHTLKGLVALCRCAESVGAMHWMLESSLRHAEERCQFGRPIRKFQAVQQMLADLASQVAAADAICNAACEFADSGDWSLLPVACVRVSEAIDRSVAVAHQIHGAIGFSREHGLNLRTRRAMQWSSDLRSMANWPRVLGDRFVGQSSPDLWERLIPA